MNGLDNIHLLDPQARAEREQRRASDPAVSAFVAASAGSGKTKLLTDRLLRLMLAGAPTRRASSASPSPRPPRPRWRCGCSASSAPG